MKYLRKNAVTLFLSLLTAVTLLCGIVLSVNPQKTYAITDTSESAVVTVGELTLSDYETRTDGKVFSGDNLAVLYKYLTGEEGATLDTVKNAVAGTQTYGNSTIAKMLTSQDIRTNVGTATGTARDIVVSFGGHEWTVTSLTTDTNGDPIVTLWLTNSTVKSKWQTYEVTNATDYGDYPPNMYATSYMRVVTLNAGGYYELDNTTLTEASQDDTNKWAKFTMSEVEGSLTSFIDTPSQIKYQEVESWPYQVHNSSGYSAISDTDYYMKNDAYGTPATHEQTTSRINGGWCPIDGNANRSNYATYAKAGQYYDNWKNDYLWLPSLAETGSGSGIVSGGTFYTIEGIWDTTENQRANSEASWLRSANGNVSFSVANLLDPAYYSAVPNTSYAVRPALHLNLAAAAKNVESIGSITVDELTLSDYETRTDGKVFNTANLSTLYQYLTGVEGATLDTVKNAVVGTQTYGNSTIAKMLTSAEIRTNVETLTGSVCDITVSFGGYDWTVTSLTTDTNGDPIVTLWLAESEETSVWQNYTVTANTDYGDYPPNMYGTSYMRVVTLNAGGSYATSNATVTSSAQSSTSKWAKFTMTDVEGSLISYIDTPSQIKYQEIESSPLTCGYTYYAKNDAYGTPDSSKGSWYSSESTSNYATYAKAGRYYNQWSNDYLWLPSLPETGGYNNTVGIWGTSENQRTNLATSWLRSSSYFDAYRISNLTADGTAGSAVASTVSCVRPALHLNLATVDLAATEEIPQVNAQVTVGGVTTDYYSIESAFDAANAATTTEKSPATVKIFTDCTTTATLTVASGSFVTLDLNGHVIQYAGTANASVLTVNGNLTLTDSDPTTEHKFTVSDSGLWVLNETDGTKTVNGGVITGGTGTMDEDSVIYGGGVSVNNGTFIMNGGAIVGNECLGSELKRGGGIAVKSEGVFKMFGGKISGNEAYGSDNNDFGGGVCIVNSTFIMYDGIISDNIAQYGGGLCAIIAQSNIMIKGGTITENTARNAGGGIYAENAIIDLEYCDITKNVAQSSGGGIAINTCLFSMRSGTVSDNTSLTGGGIYVINGSFSLLGGTISNNTTETYGGGICADSSTVTMSGGAIICNQTSLQEGSNGGGIYNVNSTVTISNGLISENVSYRGGGLFNEVNSNLIIEGGMISNNSADIYGGGIYSNGNLTMTDGAIMANRSEHYGSAMFINPRTVTTISGGKITKNFGEHGGIFVNTSEAEFKISGNPIICGNTYNDAEENIYLYDGAIIQINDVLQAGASLGVTLRSGTTITSGYSDYNTIDPSAYFFADNAAYSVVLTDGEATISQGQDYTVTFYDEDRTTVLYSIGVANGGNVAAPTPTKQNTENVHYNFAGWVTESGTAATFTNVTGDFKVYATYTEENHNLKSAWNWNGYSSATLTLYCEDCGYYITVGETTATDSTVDPTCTEAGALIYTASLTYNGVTYSDSREIGIPAMGHRYGDWIAKVEATCENDGMEAHYYCSECGAYFDEDFNEVTAESLVISARGHAYGEPVWSWNGTDSATATFTCANDASHTVTETATVASEVTTAATCETAGERTYTATVTFNGQTYTETKTESISALGHDYQAVVTAPTCTEQGYTTYTCTHDGSHTYTSDIVPATGHQWNDGVITTEATCETAGVKTYTCAVCGDTNTETIPALGHAYGEPVWSWDGTTSATATFTCEHDNTHIATETAVITEEITTQPTTETTGIKTITATFTFDGQTYTDTKTETIAKLVSDEGGKGDVVDLPPLTDPDSEYELEITVKATDKQYNMDGVNKGYLIELWIVNGDNKTAYNQNKTVTLSLVVPEGMEEFTLYRVGTDFEEVDESEYTVEGGILTIRTTLSAEFVFHTDKTDEGSKSQSGMAWYWWLIIALIVVAIIVIVVIIILKKRKKKGDPEKTPETVVQVEKYDDAELKQRLNAQQKQIDELLNRDDDGFNDIVDDK